MLLKLKFSRGDQLINIQLYICVIVLIYLCIIVISTITLLQIIFLKHLTFMDHAWDIFFQKKMASKLKMKNCIQVVHWIWLLLVCLKDDTIEFEKKT